MVCGADGAGALSVVVTHHLTSFEFVLRAAIRALGLAGFGHIQVDLRVAVPQFHVGFGAGAEDATLGVQIRCQKFNGVAHVCCP